MSDHEKQRVYELLHEAEKADRELREKRDRENYPDRYAFFHHIYHPTGERVDEQVELPRMSGPRKRGLIDFSHYLTRGDL